MMFSCRTFTTCCLPGMGSSRTGLNLEDKILWPWPQRPMALALTMCGLGFGFEIWPCWNFGYTVDMEALRQCKWISVIPGMGSSRTGLDLEDKILWPSPWPRRPLALASTILSSNTSLLLAHAGFFSCHWTSQLFAVLKLHRCCIWSQTTQQDACLTGASSGHTGRSCMTGAFSIQYCLKD